MAGRKHGSIFCFFQRGKNVCSSDNAVTEESESESSLSPAVPGTINTSRPSACEPPSKKPKRDFKEEWRAEFPWIVFDRNTMFCKICIDTKQKNTFTVSGSTNFQQSALKDHAKSKRNLLSLATLENQPRVKVHCDAAKGDECVGLQLATNMCLRPPRAS